MRRATVRQRRTDVDGRRLVNVVCPVCDHRHWIPDAGTGECSRRPGSFTIATKTTASDQRRATKRRHPA